MINTREIASEYRLAHWSQIMHERVSSGMSIKAYCEMHDIHQNVYHYWQRKLRAAAVMTTTENRVSGTPALPMPPPQGWATVTSKPADISSDTIQIEIGKSCVTADTGTNLELLSEVCRMFQNGCCANTACVRPDSSEFQMSLC